MRRCFVRALSREMDSSSPNKFVRLSVGGTRFCTTSDTCRKSPTLAALLDAPAASVVRDDEGCLFVDRSADLFGHILHFLRTDQVPTAALSFDQKTLLREEAVFFRLDLMTALLERDLERPVFLLLSADLTHIMDPYGQAYFSNILNTKESEG